MDADGSSHIFVRADSRRFIPEQLRKHEDFHDMVANNRGLLLDMVEALYEAQGEEGVARMVDAYVVALDSCYGTYSEGMTENEQRELAMLYIEEIFADQYAGMNRSSPSARQAVEAAGDVAQRFAGDIENARQNRAGIERRNGPGTRFSIEADTELEEKNITDGNAAVKSLIEQAKTSKNPESLVIENAMYRSDIGYIDLKWGTPGKGAKFKHGYGLAHIIAKRNAEVGNGEAVAYKLVEVIAKATDGEQQSNNQSTPGSERIKLHFDGYTAILSKNQEANKWLLTGWKDNETAANAVGEVRDSSNATTVTPIRTRRNGDATVSDNNIAHSSEKSNTSEEKNPDAVDWEGNRKERLSVSDEEAWKNRDIRFYPSEDADEIDRNGKENGPKERGSTSSASQSEAPSPQGEGSGRQIADATSGDGRQFAGAAAEGRSCGDGERPADCRRYRRGRHSLFLITYSLIKPRGCPWRGCGYRRAASAPKASTDCPFAAG